MTAPRSSRQAPRRTSTSTRKAVAANVVAAGLLIARAGHAQLDWSVVVPFTVTGVVAALAGQRLARRVSSLPLTRSFAVLLLVVATFVAGHCLVTLA